MAETISELAVLCDEYADTCPVQQFLGVLYLVQDYKVYGYVTNTGIRLVLIFDDKDNKDASLVKALFRKLHTLFTGGLRARGILLN